MEKQIPEKFLIKFKEGQQTKLEYAGEADGVFKYKAFYHDSDSLKNERIKLIITLEYTILNEELIP